jgi:hypothetical protein
MPRSKAILSSFHLMTTGPFGGRRWKGTTNRLIKNRDPNQSPPLSKHHRSPDRLVNLTQSELRALERVHVRGPAAEVRVS